MATKIWLIAVGVNTALLALVIIFMVGPTEALNVFVLLPIISATSSIPCLVVVFCIIRLLATVVNGKRLFGCIMAGGLLTTVFVLISLREEVGEGDREVMVYMWVTGIIAAIAGVAASYKSILQWGREFNTLENI